MDRHPGSCTTLIKDWQAKVLFATLVLCTVLSVVAAGCTGTVLSRPPGSQSSLTPVNTTITGIELVFFHPVPGCDSCERVGILANETVNTYFSPEIAAGKITFRDVNLNLPENRGIANRYGASIESLWLGEYDSTGFHATEIVDIWYYAYNREEYMQYLKGIIERKLAGTN
jgi:hypothetical protein